MDRTTRGSRLGVRLAPEEKEVIDRAAMLSGTSTAGFVRTTVLVAAREAVRAHGVVEPTAEGSRAFVEALLDPPEPNENLRALAGESGEIPSR